MYNKLNRFLRRFATLLLWMGLLLLGWAMFSELNDPKNVERRAQDAERQAQYLAERQRFCKNVRSSSLMSEMKKNEAIYDLVAKDGTVKVYVTDVWMGLPFEQKVKLDKMIQCYGQTNPRDAVIGTYYDYRTGKVVAKNGIFGFSME